MESAPKYEIILSQRDSLRRLIVAYFSRTRMIVQLATVMEQNVEEEVVEVIGTIDCDAFDQVPRALWVLISGMSNDDADTSSSPQKGESISLKKDIHVNVLSSTRQQVSVFALHLPRVTENVSWNLNTFTTLFREMTDSFMGHT